MVDSLHAILRRCEREPPVFHADQVANWPEGDMDRWVASGVLRPTSPGSSLPCSGCGGEHVGQVVFLSGPEPDGVRAFLPCPQCGPSPVSPEALRRWSVDVDRLAEVVFATIVSTPRLAPVEPGRFWRVGRAPGRAGEFTVFFGRQLHYPDANEVLRRAAIPPRAVAFVPSHPPARLGDDQGPLIFPLTEVVSWVSGSIRFDGDQVIDRLEEWLASRAVSTNTRRIRKRASRAADIAALTKEMQDHLRAARDHAISTRDHTGQAALLPRPTQEQLARRIGANQWTVSRCLADSAARELQFLWDVAGDLDRLLARAG